MWLASCRSVIVFKSGLFCIKLIMKLSSHYFAISFRENWVILSLVKYQTSLQPTAFKAAFSSLFTHVTLNHLIRSCQHWSVHSISASPPSGLVSKHEQICRQNVYACFTGSPWFTDIRQFLLPEPSVLPTTWPWPKETLGTKMVRDGIVDIATWALRHRMRNMYLWTLRGTLKSGVIQK